MHVVERFEQPGQRVYGADNQLHDLLHARLARPTRLGHRLVFLPARPMMSTEVPGRRSGSCSDRPSQRAGSDHPKSRIVLAKVY